VKVWLGWVAAVLLIALAFTGGPEAIDTAPSAAQTKVSVGEIVEKRDPQVRDDGDVGPRLADHGTPARPRLLALPPSAQTSAPIAVKAAAIPVPGAVRGPIAARGARPHLDARTPEALQIFRC
jgi:hypothetical protein